MKFETFNRGKFSSKKKIFIGVTVIVLVLVLSVSIFSYAKYQNIEDIKLAEGTVNYKVPDLNLVAMYQGNTSGGWDAITTVPTSGYALSTTNSVCNVNGTKDSSIKITYVGGKITISNLSKQGTKCYLYFNKLTTVSTALGNIQVNPEVRTTFDDIATIDEGILKATDGMYGGTSYYWRGAVTNNYVSFAGLTWRIVRINGDGTIRLIYNGHAHWGNGTSTADNIAVASTAYNSNYNRSEYVGWKYTTGAQRPTSTTAGTDAPIKTALETWYNNNIGNNSTYAAKVADGKFCNDRNVQSGSTWASQPSSTFYYAARNRVNTKTPTLSCTSTDTYALKVGLISADEVVYAGGGFANNNQYYLYNGQNYWTMSPDYWYYYNSSNLSAWVFIVNSNGCLSTAYVDNTLGVRPVINLKANTTFTGAGTASNPYVVS